MNREQPPPYAPPGQAPPYPVHPPPMAQPTVVTTAPTMVVAPTTTMIVSHGGFVDSNPSLMVCPSCRNQIVTRVEMTPSVRTHLIAALFCILTLWPCVCLPYCMGSCNNADHYCPNCNAFVGAYRF